MNLYRSIVTGGALSFCLAGGLQASAQSKVTEVQKPDNSYTNRFYASNRKPLQQLYFIKLPVGSIQPRGWLQKYLELQRDGLTGQLGEISAWLAKKNNAWLSADGKGDHGWEEVPYWLKGYANLGYVLKDKKIIDESRIWLESALKSQRPDGYFGPMILRNGKPDLWGNMIMLWCLQSYYEYSNDQRVLPFMENYFRWQYNLPDSMMLKDYWENSRGGDNMLSVYWLYNRTTGDKKWLLDLAAKLHRNTADWKQKDNLPNWHNVNIAQGFREPATYYLQTGSREDWDATYNVFNLIRERFGNVPGGMFGADENARKGYVDPRQGVETCGMVEQMASNEILLGITGDPFWADHTENVAFNTYPAAVMPDFKALRYITSPNMSVSDSKNHHPGIDNSGPFVMMNPFSSRCCQHNHAQGWPYYAEHVFMATPDNGIAAILYSEAVVKAKVGNGTEVGIASKGHYPFDEAADFTFTLSKSTRFPFYLRIPEWCADAQVKVNGVVVKKNPSPSSYIRIERLWKSGDKVQLDLPMQLKVNTWTSNKNSISVNRGPLTYSLKIKEEYKRMDSKKSAIGDSKWQESADADKWPSFEILPGSSWNYGLVYKGQDPKKLFKVVKKSWPATNFPFTQDAVPISITTTGKRIDSWKIDQYGLTDTLPQSPVIVGGKEETIELIPMGAARLRIAAFPVVQ
ncbi:glycoside hydrolase family 127 protein [Niabella yanshanensis]|uniref:Glycoside hydrolase family 127 protein n=1 Tax=Niabella yanshanensis TaxID=577386 RepID=A0ABZ0WCT5_9BACT|nr:beta-L-arabinofuranosidase domain-containing protein [Niabella yanshanensis]WQD39797.1 glycoside hydrolase family 127 protein [Niabella yanshanensis]